MVGKYIVVDFDRLQKEYNIIKEKYDNGYFEESERTYFEGQLDILDDLLKGRI